MANELQNSLFTAIDTIIGQRVEELDLDKTVVGSIVECEDALIRKYRVEYKGGTFSAYGQTDEVYSPHTSVYISVPQNDFTQKKWILGKVSTTQGDRAITEVSAALDDYQIVGHNTISVTDKSDVRKSDNGEFGLWSYQQIKLQTDSGETEKRQYDSIVLYDKNKEDNYLHVDNNKLKKYMEQSIALLIEATFRTDLDYDQKIYANEKGSDYALEFSLVFEHGDNTYKTYGAKFEAIAPNIIVVNGEEPPVNLTFYDEKIRGFTNDDFLYAPKEGENREDIPFTIQESLNTMHQNLTGLRANGAYTGEELEFLNNYIPLLGDMILKIEKSAETKSLVWEQLFNEYNAWFKTSADTLKEKRVVYSLTSDQMLGNPYLYKIPTEQYDMFRIDGGRFKCIESIVFYCKDFDIQEREFYYDIFVKDIEFYGLQELSSVNGDYRLLLDFPKGFVFDDSNENSDTLKVNTKFYCKQEKLTTGLEYYWFKKDSRVINAGHRDYHIRGGVGWSYIDKPVSESSLDVAKFANTAYENMYKCVVVYNASMTLKYEFSIFNESNRRTIEIESNLGERFQFDRGTPILTCKLKDNIMGDSGVLDSYPDNYVAADGTEYQYQYTWSRKYESGQAVIFEKTYEEWAILYESVAATDLNAKSLYKANMAEMQGVGLKKNELTYPAAKIAANTSVIFECSVFRKKSTEEEFVDIGSASIVLKNEAAAVINDYHIVIENGDQVFQYNEYGVSPCKEKVQENPVVPKDLICHLYDPAGLEVTSSQYIVKWEYPVENTLIISPNGLRENPSNGLVQWHVHPTAPVAIQESYDYSALNNQITCIVVYDGKTITKTTEFYFGKIGDNGTNGTDVVAVIDEWSEGNKLDNEPLTLIVSNQGMVWNTGLPFNEATTPLELSLFRRNKYIDPSEYKNVKWTMAGGASKSNRFAAAASSATPHLANITSGTGKYSNYIIKGEAKLDKVDGNNERQTHYAFYPIPVIEYESQISNRGIAIDKAKTLKHILYNADGRNPLYNNNQGVFFNFSLDPNSKYTVSWEAKGGLTDNEDLPAFDLYYDKDSTGAEGTLLPANTLSTVIQKTPYVYIKPKDVYGGAAQNNHVVATIYIKEVVGNALTEIKIATVYIPIYMSLNLYGLASLNAWDGNTVEINEDNNYIMTPQIGAGVKEEDNTFTGIVMGKATTYDSKDEVVGLLGYSKGRQSIFLDAETGNATFGLPEIDERDPNQQNLNEGRIELRPGGLSSIANWKINSRMLFNVPEAEKDNSEEYNTWGGLGEPYSDLGDEYIKSIPHDKSGVLISSDPAYFSIKGKQLTVEDKDIDFTLSNTIVKPGDTFELQLNPNDNSIFTIYRHTKTATNTSVGVIETKDGLYIGNIASTDDDVDATPVTLIIYSTPRFVGEQIVGWETLECDENGDYFIAYPYEQHGKKVWVIKEVKTKGYYSLENFEEIGSWRREKRVGINQQGRFYTNALRSSSSALNIDNVGAFGESADTGRYIGASFEVGPTEDSSYSLVKMFMDSGVDGKKLENETEAKTATLFISGASESQNEYMRPIKMYGKEIRLYSDDEENSTPFSLNEIAITSDFSYMGISDSDRVAERTKGSFLLLHTENPSQLHSLSSFNTIIGEIQNETDEDGQVKTPWLLNNFKVPAISENNTGVADQVTKISYGSIANYVYGGDKTTDITDNYSGGHILNYATGSLQLNKAKQLTEETTDDNGNEVPATYGIDKTLQINDNNVLLGHVKISDEELNTNWLTQGIGSEDLYTTLLEETSAFEMTKDRTSLISAPRIGIYGQNDIEIQAMKKSDVVGGSIVLIADHENAADYAGLYLTPNSGAGTTEETKDLGAFKLYSQYGSVYSRIDARGSYSKSPKNGVMINPGLTAGYGIFTGTIDGSSIGVGYNTGLSIHANGNIRGEDFYFNDLLEGWTYIDNDNTKWEYFPKRDGSGNPGSVWYHIANLYEWIQRAQRRANSAQTRADDAYDKAVSAAGSLPNHTHNITRENLMATTGAGNHPYVTINGNQYPLSNYGYSKTTSTGGPIRK